MVFPEATKIKGKKRKMASDHSLIQTCKEYFAKTSNVHALIGLLQLLVCTRNKFLYENSLHMCWKTQLLALLSDSWHLGPLIKKDLLQLK